MVVDKCLQQGIHHSHQASEYPLSPSYLLQDEPAKRLQKELEQQKQRSLMVK
jgi:hypothetical protein